MKPVALFAGLTLAVIALAGFAITAAYGSPDASRAVWTSAAGEQIFSVLEGEPLGTGRRVNGRITGGTGRFAGATGDYSLTWQYVVQADDDVVQGRAADLRGRIRLSGPRP